MKKLLFLIVLMPFLAKAQKNSQRFKLNGKVQRIAFKPDWVYLQYRTNGEWKTDSLPCSNGKYSFTGEIAEPVLARLRVKYQLDDAGKKVPMVPARDMAAIFIQPGRIKVSAVDSFSNVKVKGSVAHKEYEKLKAQEKPFQERMDPLIAKYREYANAKDAVNQAKTEGDLDAIEKEKNEKVYGEFVKKNPSSPIAMYALQQYAGWDIDADKIEPLFNALSEKIRSYPSAVDFQMNLETAQKTGIGKTAMEFTQNDTLGIPVSLSAFRGRYVLVDFWASWCGPCRSENPNVVKVFNKYKDRNFHIIGVSLDRPGQNAKWMKAINDDKLRWTHVSDLKFWDNEVAKQYGIKAIPQNLLIDPSGKIIAKNLRGEELEAKLGELIK
ncbi:MAG: TlpA disulfide reductase family protein [Chitinophagaceae bacterium]